MPPELYKHAFAACSSLSIVANNVPNVHCCCLASFDDNGCNANRSAWMCTGKMNSCNSLKTFDRS